MSNWTDDQGLADIFVKYAPFFKAYTTYVLAYDEGAKLLNSMREKRLGIRSAEAAAAAHGIESLPDLICLPRDVSTINKGVSCINPAFCSDYMYIQNS